MKHALAIFIIILLANWSFAEDTQNTKKILLKNKRVNLYCLDMPERKIYNNLLSQVTFNHRMRGTVKETYVGLYGLLTDEANKRLKRYSRRQTRILYNNSDMTFEEAEARFAAASSSYNPYGEWWERPWWASLPPGKGGAPLEQNEIKIGQEINLPNWEIINWGKRQIEKLGDIWLTNDSLYEGIEDNDELTIPGINSNQPNDKINEYTGRTNADIIIDQSTWFSGDFYHFRFKPSLRIRGGPNVDDMIDELSLKFVIELYTTDMSRKHFGNLSFYAKYNIKDNECLASVIFDLITW